MKPTPEQLAIIAATLAHKGDARQYIGKALELYEACANALLPPETTEEDRHKLDDVLFFLMPQDPPSRRKKLLHEFLTEQREENYRAVGRRPVDSEIAPTVRDFLEEFKTAGVPKFQAIKWRDEFPHWRKARTSANRATAANAMHAKRKEEATKRKKDTKRKAPKHRIEYHPPDMLQALADKETQREGQMHD